MRQRPEAHEIRLHLANLEQLFNSMDPSPFHEKDLDADAEEFIVSWAYEHRTQDPIALVIQLDQGADNPEAEALVRRAVHHYFGYRARLNAMEFARLMRQGQTSLAIGLVFLLACFVARELMSGMGEGAVASFARESVIIAGWVAMWRPMQIYLYDWWPLRRRGRIFTKLSRMPVRMRPHRSREAHATPAELPEGATPGPRPAPS